MLKQKLFSALSNTVATAKPFLLRRSLIVPKETIRYQLQQFRSNYFEWRGQQFHYIDEGIGEPVLMIHGFSGSHYNFEKLSVILKNDYRVIRIDLPGNGLSDFPAEEQDLVKMYRTFVNDFVEWLRLPSFYIMGVSLGGFVSWLYSVDHPEKLKGAVFLDAFGYDVKKARKNVLGWVRYSRLSVPVLRKGVPAHLLRKSLSKAYENPVNEDLASRTVKMLNTEGNIDAFLRFISHRDFPSESLIKNVRIPTLIIWGKQDRLIPVKYASRFHQDIKNSTLIIIDNCGHMPMVEYPERVSEAFVSWTKTAVI